MSKWKWAGLVALLVATNAYSLLVGKYEYFPYRQISAFKQRLIAAMETDYFFIFERQSPKVQEAQRLAEAGESRRISQYQAVSDVVERIRGIIYESAPQVPDFDVALPAPSGYVVDRSVPAGMPLKVFVHAPEGAVAEVFRLGRAKTSVRRPTVIAPVAQSPRYSPTTGLAWKANLHIDTSGLKSGHYLIELRNSPKGGIFQIPFIIKPGKAPRVAFIASTNTWQAFNEFGGKNFWFFREVSG